ncbi:MAG: hypothetical protein ACI8ZM_001079 [Crocinitomix sp.]|jgi:hypothetical protein
MKKFLIFCCITIALTSCSDSHSIDDPNKFGKHIFEKLKGIATDSKEDFLAEFLFDDEYNELVENSSESDRYTFENLEKGYFKIKEKGASYGIKWQDIEYLDCVYKEKEKEGIQICGGRVFFGFEDTTYKVDFDAVKVDDGYRLTGIGDFRKD